MFPRDSGTELESGCLRSGRRFRSRKRRKTLLGRGSCSTTREEEGYELPSHLDEGSYNREEEYQLISEGDEESEELTKAPDPGHGYNSPMTPRTSLEVRSRDLYPSAFINTSITNTVNNGQGSPASQG